MRRGEGGEGMAFRHHPRNTGSLIPALSLPRLPLPSRPILPSAHPPSRPPSLPGRERDVAQWLADPPKHCFHSVYMAKIPTQISHGIRLGACPSSLSTRAIPSSLGHLPRPLPVSPPSPPPYRYWLPRFRTEKKSMPKTRAISLVRPSRSRRSNTSRFKREVC